MVGAVFFSMPQLSVLWPRLFGTSFVTLLEPSFILVLFAARWETSVAMLPIARVGSSFALSFVEFYLLGVMKTG